MDKAPAWRKPFRKGKPKGIKRMTAVSALLSSNKQAPLVHHVWRTREPHSIVHMPGHAGTCPSKFLHADHLAPKGV